MIKQVISNMKKAVFAGLVSLGLLNLQAKDWPQWGGDQHRNMFSDEKGLPERFEPRRDFRPVSSTSGQVVATVRAAESLPI